MIQVVIYCVLFIFCVIITETVLSWWGSHGLNKFCSILNSAATEARFICRCLFSCLLWPNSVYYWLKADLILKYIRLWKLHTSILVPSLLLYLLPYLLDHGQLISGYTTGGNDSPCPSSLQLLIALQGVIGSYQLLPHPCWNVSTGNHSCYEFKNSIVSRRQYFTALCCPLWK